MPWYSLGVSASSAKPSSGPSIAPQVSIARCTPKAVPSSSCGLLSEIIASRGAVRIPLPIRSMSSTAARPPKAVVASRPSLQIAERP